MKHDSQGPVPIVIAGDLVRLDLILLAAGEWKA